jgi:steroid Delta-isomerase
LIHYQKFFIPWLHMQPSKQINSEELIMSNITTTLSPERIQATIDRYFAATRSANKAAEMVACFAPDTVSYDPADGPALVGHSGLQQFFEQIGSLFTELGLTADFSAINGNEAAVKWSGQGIGKNGVAVTFEGIDLFEFNTTGHIQTMRAYWNPAATIAQLQ